MDSKHFDLVPKAHIKNEYIVTAVRNNVLWENGMATDRSDGFKLRTINPSANFSETIIKVKCKELPISSEQVEENPVVVAFTDLVFSSYFSSMTKRTEYVGTATGLKVLNEVK